MYNQYPVFNIFFVLKRRIEKAIYFGKWYMAIMAFSLLSKSSFSQSNKNDTINLLNEVTVTSNRVTNFSAGTKILRMDSLSLNQHNNQNLSDLLADESPIFVKSYGLGSLATSSFRGGSANHTAILWNGFNINSPMNGQWDLALVPVNFCDAVSIQYGGTSALWGSGAVGGTIHLTNSAKFNTGITSKINLSAGSFGSYNQQLSLEFSKKRVISSIKLFNSSAQNNFQYTNIFLPNDAKVTQSNASLRNYGLLFENYFLIKENQRINLFFWYQYTDRDIPPTMLQAVNKSNQIDNNYRITSEWKYDKKKATTYVRAAYFNEKLFYIDHIYQDNSDTNRAQTVITEAETKINLSPQHFANIGFNNTYATAITSGYPNKPQQNRTALFASYLLTSKNEKFRANVSVRQEVVKGKFIPFTYSIGGDYQFLKWVSVKANVSRVYRIPTFNDLYWNPGGNPNLKPESGYAEEIGLNLNLKHNRLTFISDVTVFNRNMENWIIWLPGVSYWSPQNIMNVWSRGFETNSSLSLKIDKTKITFSVLTNYVVSTNEEATSENDVSVGKQIIYVPMYSGHAKISIEFKGFAFSYRHNYTGYRFTSTDDTQYLPPYSLGSVYLSYKINLKNSSSSIFIQANNIWNEQYQVMLDRAMPGQNYNAGISFEFNKPNNKQLN